MDYALIAVLAVAAAVVLLAGLVALRAHRRRKQDARVEVAEPAAQPELVERAQPAPRGATLTDGLRRTREALSGKLRALASRDRVSEGDWDEIEEALIRADVGYKVAGAIVERLQKKDVNPSEVGEELRHELVRILDEGDRRFVFNPSGPSVWLIAGVNGTGKTTSIAKLAHLLGRQGHSVVLAAADTFRAAAIDQLGEWAARAGVHMIRHAPGGDPGAVVFDALAHAKAKSVEVVIVDTAGRLHTKTHLMDELKKIRRIAEREAGGISEALLVLDATVGQNGIAQGRVFAEAVDLTGVVLTKLDGTARGGVVVAIQEELGIPVKAVGLGESIDDLELFDPATFAEALLA